MSYCVNCGVELSASEKKCPLCETEVLNPNSPWTEPEQRPYPKKLELIDKRATRRFFLAMASLLMLMPVVITVLCDFIYSRSITWSAYVLGSTALTYVLVIVPFALKKPYPPLCIALDVLACGLFLYGIEYTVSGDWFLPIALPILLIIGAACLFLALLFLRGKLTRLIKAAITLFIIGSVAFAVEVIIKLYTDYRPMFEWSPYVLAVGIILGVLAIITNKRRRFKDEVRRRFFV